MSAKSPVPAAEPRKKERKPPSPQAAVTERVLSLYGDLLFDLCEAVLWSPINAQLAFRQILKIARRQARAQSFQTHERAWILQIACEHLITLANRHGRRLTPSEQIQLDSTASVASRLQQFDSYFHRLTAPDQILLLLRDKYGLPYSEISSALGVPEGTIKLRRIQALRALEEWLWDGRG